MEMTFNNVSEFKRYLDKNKNKPSVNDVLTTTDSFYGTESWEEFEDYLAHGNKDITADIKKHSQYYINKFEELYSEASNYEFDVVGEFFDIGAVMMGEPEAWIKEIKVVDEKFIELKIQGSYSHKADLDLVRKNGSKVLAIATVLEQQGFLVRIDISYSLLGCNVSNAKTKRQTDTVLIKVKDYDSGLDYKKFGILLGVPFFRRGVLRLMEIEHGYDTKATFGFPTSLEGEIRLDVNDGIDALENQLKG